MPQVAALVFSFLRLTINVAYGGQKSASIFYSLLYFLPLFLSPWGLVFATSTSANYCIY